MNVTELIDYVYKSALFQLEENSNKSKSRLTNGEVISCWAHDIVHEELDWQVPENEEMLEKFVSDPQRYKTLEYLNKTRGLTREETREYFMLFGIGVDVMAVKIGRMCIEKYNVK